MSNPTTGTETAPLNPPPSYDDGNPALSLHETTASNTQPGSRGPFHLFVLYGLSLVISVFGLGCAFWGWYIVRTAPFDERGKQTEIDSYEKYFYGMQSIYALLSISILWTGMNLYLLKEGKVVHNDIASLNTGYDILIWAMLIGFGVLNMIVALWDRRLCDGWGNEKEAYKRCDKAQFRLLVVELVAVTLGFLVAVVHFILLVERYCTQRQRDGKVGSIRLQSRTQEEEDVLRGSLERRRLLEEENDEFEGGHGSRRERDLPPLPTSDHPHHADSREEDLIDIGGEARG